MDFSNIDEEMGIEMEPRNSSSLKTAVDVAKTINHAILVIFIVVVFYAALKNDIQLFTWHPILMALGWVFLMSQAILGLSKESGLLNSFSVKLRIRGHWLLQVSAITTCAIGTIIVYINKERLNKPHFHSWHGLLGICSMISCIPTVLNGVLALYNVSLRTYLKPAISKLLHVTSGVCTFILGTITISLSLYTKWFDRVYGGTFATITLIILLFSFIWTLKEPVVDVYNRFRMLSVIRR